MMLKSFPYNLIWIKVILVFGDTMEMGFKKIIMHKKENLKLLEISKNQVLQQVQTTIAFMKSSNWFVQVRLYL